MNKKAIIIIVGVVVVAGLAGAYVMMQPKAGAPTATNESTSNTSDESDTTHDHDALNPTQPSGNTGNATDQAAISTEIVYTNSGFSPRTVTVKKGTTIKVTNNSSNSLQFSSDDHPTHTKDPELNMSTIAPNQSGSLKLEKTGTWGVHNHLMPNDTCTVTVVE